MLTSYASRPGGVTRGIAPAHVEQRGTLHRSHISPGKCRPPHARRSSGQQSRSRCGCRTSSNLSLRFHSQLSLSSCSSGNWTSTLCSSQYRSLYCDRDKCSMKEGLWTLYHVSSDCRTEKYLISEACFSAGGYQRCFQASSGSCSHSAAASPTPVQHVNTCAHMKQISECTRPSAQWVDTCRKERRSMEYPTSGIFFSSWKRTARQ